MRDTTNDGSSRIHYGIILNVLLLCLVGLMALYVAVFHDSTGGSPIKAVAVQSLWYVLGAIAVIVIMQFDAEQLWRIAPYVYGFGLFLLIAVLFFYSRAYFDRWGAKSWFALGPLTFQPSEVMKPAFILMLAKVVNQHNSRHGSHSVNSDWRLLSKMFLALLPVLILLKLQKDFGTALVFVAIFSGVVIVSGITWRILLPVLGVASAVGGGAIALVSFKFGRTILGKIGFHAYQFDRIDSWLNPSQNTTDQGYQIWQSIKAVGSGLMTGKGFNHNPVYVPVRASDMIFSVIGENFGFMGSCFLILLYFLLIHQMIRIVVDTKNEFYAYISTGVIMMILFHVFENIGMCIGLLPLTGIPLPFISQSGSALLANMIGVGFIMSMRYHYKSYMFSTDESFK